MLSAVRPMLLSGRCAAACSRSSTAWFSSTRDEEGGPESGLAPGAFGGATAGSDNVSGPGPHKELGQAEGGTSGGIAGTWRGMTSSFSVGVDDMAGDAASGTVADDVGMKVDADDGLPPGPNETSGAAAQAHAGGFGQTRDPQAHADRDAPADLAQKAKEANSSSSSNTTQAEPKPWSS